MRAFDTSQVLCAHEMKNSPQNGNTAWWRKGGEPAPTAIIDLDWSAGKWQRNIFML